MVGENPYGDGLLVDSLRISDAEWYACVHEMDLRSAQYKKTLEKRSVPRQAYRNIARIIVTIQTFGGQTQQFKARAYDLSEHGIGFLHGAYVYKDTPAEILMQHHVNGMTRIHATIVNCEHVKKRIHRVGAKFEEPINLEDYLMNEAG
jgi:hypothetical protein